LRFSDYSENKIIDAFFNATSFGLAGNPWVALHTADPGDTGTSEVTGGSYARQQTDFTAASSGSTSNVATITFTSMPAVTVAAIGVWDASTAGNFLMGGWLSTVTQLATCLASTDILTAYAHGFANSDRVAIETEVAGDLPTGLTAGTLYYVVGSTTDTFQLSATDGGAAVNFTTNGEVLCYKVTPQTLQAGNNFQVSAGQLVCSVV
jgi:hypothetical protein